MRRKGSREEAGRGDDANSDDGKYDTVQKINRSASMASANGAQSEAFLFNLQNLAQFEQDYYQSDLRRFETQTNYASNISAGAQRQNSYIQEPEESILTSKRSFMSSQTVRRRQTTTDTIENMHKTKNMIVKKDGWAEKQVLKRKICRLMSLVGCILFIIAVFVFLYAIGYRKETLQVSFLNQDVVFNLQNCRLFLSGCTSDCPSSNMQLDYRSSPKTIFSKLLGEPTPFGINYGVSSVGYSVEHFDDIKGCSLSVWVPEAISLKSLTINCTSECVVIQKAGKLTVQNLTIKGNHVSTNFNSLVAGHTNIEIIKGYLQVNNMTFLTGTYTRSAVLGDGDIMISTEKQVQVNYETASENYCLAGISTQITAPAVKTTLALPLLEYRTQVELQAGTFNDQWTGSVTLCNIEAACTPTAADPVLVLKNFDGNIYVNVHDVITNPLPSKVSLAKGSNYGSAVDLPLSAELLVQKNLDDTKDKNLANLIIKFMFGNYQAWSVYSHDWVFTDHPILSILKPWWVSFFTLGYMVDNSVQIDTYLSPGFCPMRKVLDRSQHFQITQMLMQEIGNKDGIYQFLKPSEQPLDQQEQNIKSGFIEFAENAQFSDQWVRIMLINGENLQYLKVQLTENIDAFSLLTILIIVTLLIALRINWHMVTLLLECYEYLKRKMQHIELYWRFNSKLSNSNRKDGIQFNVDEDEGADKQNQTHLGMYEGVFAQKKYSELPPVSSFIDFLRIELLTSSRNSLEFFYKMAFEEADYNKIIDLEMQNNQQVTTPLKTLKSLYQQTCFLMGFKEEELSSQVGLSLLRKKGMVLSSSETRKQYLIRITMNANKDLGLPYLKNEKRQNSLEIFLEKFCEKTNFDEDKIPLEVFEDRYNLFCKLNHLELMMIDNVLLKNQFGIETKTSAKEMVCRDLDQIYQKDSMTLIGLFQKVGQKFQSCFSKKRFYNLKVDRVKNINVFLADRLTEADVGKEEFRQIVENAIFEDYWWFNDFVSVMIELLVELLLSVPFLSIFIFQEIEHSIYSTRDENLNIYGFNYSSNDIWLLPQKITQNTLLLAVSILFGLFWITCIFNLVVNIWHLEFPWIKIFDPFRRARKPIVRIFNAYQWLFIFFSFIIIVWYAFLVVVSTTSSCIIKGQAYLSVISISLSFLFLLYRLDTQYSSVWGIKDLLFLSHFKSIWSSRLREIVKRMLKRMSERNGALMDLTSDESLRSSQPSNDLEKLQISEMNLNKLSLENPKAKNFIQFFYSLVNQDASLRANLEKLMRDPPFNMNKYTCQLVSSVMFMSKSVKLDRFNIEKTIEQIVSVLYYYKGGDDKDDISNITIRDLGNLVPCSCDVRTPVVKKMLQSSRDPKESDGRIYCCAGLGCDPNLYNNEAIQEAIRSIRFNDNAKMMVHTLDILSNLQKRKIDQVLKIIEKIFLESFSEKRFERVKPILDLIHFIIFNLKEDYDYVKLTEIFINFLKKTLSVDMQMTEILMLYLLKDHYILSNQKDQDFTHMNTSSIYKKQICNSGLFSHDKKMLVQYLSLSTAFVAAEPRISPDLVSDFQKSINEYWSPLGSGLSNTLVSQMIHFPLCFTQSYKLISQKISEHAEVSNISKEISDLITNFTMLANGTITIKSEFEEALKLNKPFQTIKKKFGINFKELLGIIYLMKGDLANDHVDRIITLILNKYNLLHLKKPLDTLMILYASSDRTRIRKALQMFKRYCVGGNAQFNILVEVFEYFRGFVQENEKFRVSVDTFFTELPSKRVESDLKLRHAFNECIQLKSIPKFRTFKDIVSSYYKGKNSLKTEGDLEFIKILNIVEVLFEFNFATNPQDLLVKLKEFVPELEISTFYNICFKLLKTVSGFKLSMKSASSDRLKESFNSLGEIMIGRPSDFEQLWRLIFSQQGHKEKLGALDYFVEVRRRTNGEDDYKYKYHSLYIEKRITSLKLQMNFIAKFNESTGSRMYKFGMTIIKRLFMNNFNLAFGEINMILSILTTIDNPAAKTIKSYEYPEDQGGHLELAGEEVGRMPTSNMKKTERPTDETHFESNSLTRFYTALIEYVINQDGSHLGNYFLEEHDEPMLKNLAYCRFSKSINDVVNKIFEHMIKMGQTKVCSLLYLYYTIVRLTQRREIHLKPTLEKELNSWLGIKPEFFDFLELFASRRSKNLVDMLYKIQTRVLHNLYSNKKTQKATGLLENVLTRELYENIDGIIRGEQVNLNYMASLFKVPIKKMRFIHILTTLKQNYRVEYAFDQFLNNQDIRKMLEVQGINPQELVFLLKICLNEIDYDSITDLLRLLKLDHSIIPEILINLLLVDLKVDRKPISMNQFSKRMLVHSAIFEKLGENKEVCWAICRVLKGDFLIFSELFDGLSEDMTPQNHKYFSNIMTGLVGVKNAIHSDSRMLKTLNVGGVPQYGNMLTAHFSKFQHGGAECTFEYAQFLLQNALNGFKAHPFWAVAVDIFKDSNLQKRCHDLDTVRLARLNFLCSEPNVPQFIIIYNLVNASDSVIEFIHDFAFFRSMSKYLTERWETARPKLTSLFEKDGGRLERFMQEKVMAYKKIFKQLILDKRIVLSYEHMKTKSCPIFLGFLLDACGSGDLQEANYYLGLNKPVMQRWRAEITNRGGEGNPRLARKLDDIFQAINQIFFDPFKLFVTKENKTLKEYWERMFEDESDFDEYLDHLVEIFMEGLEGLTSDMYDVKSKNIFDVDDLTQGPGVSPGQQPDADDSQLGADQDDDGSSDDSEDEKLKGQASKFGQSSLRPSQFPSKQATNATQADRDESSFGVTWYGLPVYILLDRLRAYQNLSYEEKVEKTDEILYKVNILFKILEKSMYFLPSGESFRKFKYFEEFVLSMGIKLPNLSWIRYSGSLFMPEVFCYQKYYFERLSASNERNPITLNQNAANQSKQTNSEDPDLIFVKSYMVMKLLENDMEYFRNNPIFSLFCYAGLNSKDENPDDQPSVIDGHINLRKSKPDAVVFTLGKITEKFPEKPNNGSDSTQFLKDTLKTWYSNLYTLYFYTALPFRGAAERKSFLYDLIERQQGQSGGQGHVPQYKFPCREPVLVSLSLIKKGFYPYVSEYMKFVSPRTAQLDNNSDEKKAYSQKLVETVYEIYITRSWNSNEFSFLPADRRSLIRANTKLQVKSSNLSFLNDIALGKYSVLSETKNIFTENYELAQYQKIYESILHLHSSKRMFDRKQLSNSLKVLKPYMTSGTFNLNSVIEFVVEPPPTHIEALGTNESQKHQMQNLYLFNELQLRNQSFYHLFLLHKYPNDIRKEYIKKIVEDIGIIELGRVKSIVMCLLNLCYMANAELDVSFTIDEFKILAEGILGSNSSESENSKSSPTKAPSRPPPQDLGTSILEEPDNGLTARPNKEGADSEQESVADLVQLVYNNITSNDMGRNTISKRFKQFLKVIGSLIQRGGIGVQQNLRDFLRGRGLGLGSGMPLAEVSQLHRNAEMLNSFILDISKKNKKSYLMKFQRGKDEINELLGVKESYLLGVFDIINSITSTKPIDQANFNVVLSNFFCSKFFKETAITPEIRARYERSYSMVYAFIFAFYKSDIKEVLGFLRRYSMKDTYCFVISYYCYICTLNGLHQNKPLSSKTIDTVAKCLLFPLIQQITSGIYAKEVFISERFMFSTDKIRNLNQKITEAIWQDTYDLEFLTVFATPEPGEAFKAMSDHSSNPKRNKDTSGCERLFKGEAFKVFEAVVDEKLTQYLTEEKHDAQTMALVSAISKVKKLFYFQNAFYEDPEKPAKEKSSQAQEKQKAESASCRQLIQSAYKLRDNWEDIRRSLTSSIIQSSAKSQYFKKLMKELMQNDMQFFEFLGIKGGELEKLKQQIYQMMIFVFIYLKELRVYLDLNDSNSTQTVMKNALGFMWILIKEMIKGHPEKDPFERIGLKRKIIPIGQSINPRADEAKEYEDYVEFLNKYTFLIYNLKHLRSDSKMLNEIIGFLKIYVFVKNHNSSSDTKRLKDALGRDIGGRPPGITSNQLYGDLKPESFMELYDYLEELEQSKDLSENYKENILNLFIQIVSPHERFKKHITDIKGLVKLMQRDYSKLDHFVDKLFSRSENASYAKANFKNYIACHQKARQGVWDQAETGQHESSILAMPKQDRETLFKRAEDGTLTPHDVFLLLRGRVIRNSYVGFHEVELIFRRLGIRLTEHRLCEFLAAAKLIHAKKCGGFYKLSHSFLEEGEFECLFEYLEASVNCLTKQSLHVSPQDLMQFSLLSMLVFCVAALVAGSLVRYFYGGDLFGAILCALVPITSVWLVTRSRMSGGPDSTMVKEAIEKSFTTITNSRVSSVS